MHGRAVGVIAVLAAAWSSGACSSKSASTGNDAAAGAGGGGGGAANADAALDLPAVDGRGGCADLQLPCNGYCLKAGDTAGNCTTLIVGPAATGIAVSATHVYYDDLLSDNISRVPVQGGQPQVVVSDSNVIAAFSLDATSVYFTTSLGGALTSITMGAVRSVPLAGGTSRLLTNLGGRNPDVLAVDGTDVYWVSESSSQVVEPVLHRVPIAGGAVTDLADGLSPTAIAVDATSVYWYDGVLFKMAKTGPFATDDAGTTTTKSVLATGNDLQIALDGDSLDVTDAVLGGLYRVPKDGSHATKLTDSINSLSPLADATDVYFATLDGEIIRYRKADQTTTTIATTEDRSVVAMAMDATAIYAVVSPVRISPGIVRIAK